MADLINKKFRKITKVITMQIGIDIGSFDFGAAFTALRITG